VHKVDNLPPFCPVATKSGNLNFLEPSGPVQACNGTDFFNGQLQISHFDEEAQVPG